MQGAGASSMRVLMRALLLLFPGFSDHLPCDYESALREELPLAIYNTQHAVQK